MSEYPEHEKLRALGGANQIVGNFIEWLGEQGLSICSYVDRREEYWPINKSRDSILAEHFEIDRQKLEEEKRAMLAEIRGESVE